MFRNKEEIKEYIEQLSPEVLKISEVSVRDITLLGSGESNLNYLADLGSKKVVFRLHLEDNTRDKPKKEYLILKKIECLNIAPKALLYDISNTEGSFIILEYVEGNALPSDYQLSDKQFLTLAKELAVLHSSSVHGGVPKNKFSYSGYLARFEADIEYIKRKLQIGKIKDTFVETLYKIDAVMRKDVRENKVKNLFSMTHGDIAPQNMVETDSGFKFIDWESAGIGDPAAEIVFVIDEIGFPITKKQKKLFVEEYFNYCKDPTLKERISLFKKLIRFEQVLWCIKRVYEIKDRELSKAYLKKETLLDILGYMKDCVMRLVKCRIGCSKKDFEPKLIFPEKFRIQLV